MIIPSKWMVGGRGLDKFRGKMLSEKRIKALVDFENASECFPGVHLDGGVCYFLWDRYYYGKTDYTFISNKKERNTSLRYLKNDNFKYVIRDNRITRIIGKINSKESFSKIISSTRPYGIRMNLFNKPYCYPESKLSSSPFDKSIKIYGVKGLKGGAKRKVGYIKRKTANRNIETIDRFKLFFTTSYSTNAIIPPEIIKGFPGEICTETYLLVGPFENEMEQQNCYDYMHTKFFRALLYFGKGTVRVTKSVFGLIPLCDFKQSWSDEKLFSKYELSKNEVKFIDSFFLTR